MAGIGEDLEFLHWRNQTFPLFFEISRVGEWQAGACLRERSQGELRGRFAFGMEVAHEGSRRSLSARRAAFQQHATGYRECCPDCWKRLHERTPRGRHLALLHR